MAHASSRYNLVAFILILIAILLSNTVAAARSSSNMMPMTSMNDMAHTALLMAEMGCYNKEQIQPISSLLTGCSSDIDNSTFDQCCSKPLCVTVMVFLPIASFTVPLSFHPSRVIFSRLFEPLQRAESLYRPPIAKSNPVFSQSHGLLVPVFATNTLA